MTNLLTDKPANTFNYLNLWPLFRAQLSNTELLLLGLNLWASSEGEKMTGIAEEYGLLKHMPAGDLRSELESTLSPKVFGRGFSVH